MKEIATISPERLNNGAHYQFMTSVLNYAVADEKIAEETHLKPLVQNLTTALAKEDEDLKISQKSLLTDDIAYRELVKMTNALALVLGEADYANFIDYVNTEISHYKQEVINGRSTSTKEEEVEKK